MVGKPAFTATPGGPNDRKVLPEAALDAVCISLPRCLVSRETLRLLIESDRIKYVDTEFVRSKVSQKDADNHAKRIRGLTEKLFVVIRKGLEPLDQAMLIQAVPQSRLDQLLSELEWLLEISKNLQAVKIPKPLFWLVGGLLETYQFATHLEPTLWVDANDHKVKGTFLRFFEIATQGLFVRKPRSGNQVRTQYVAFRNTFGDKGEKLAKLRKNHLLRDHANLSILAPDTAMDRGADAEQSKTRASRGPDSARRSSRGKGRRYSHK